MKNLLITLCFLFSATLAGWAQTDYQQWETHRFKVKMGQNEMFEKGLAAHNKKYHTTDPYKTGIFSILSGPNSGEYELVIGPMTFSQMEGRPSGAEHDADWDKNVLPYVESVGPTIYWRADKDITYRPAGADGFLKSRWRNFTILPGQFDRLEGLFKQVVEVYKAKNYNAAYTIYWRHGASQGPHAVAEISFNSWSWLDQPSTMEKDFLEVHGEGSWRRFMDEFELCIDRAKTFDELVEFKPTLSSN